MQKQPPALGAAVEIVAEEWKAEGEGVVEPGRILCAKRLEE